ncbi:hypothetical protein [Streptomyces sp. MBT33]|uniref:hypothetical protein n=1 Tax=Streptomyces sp. MBT33 TaxID=1488363 RepID=UPI00190972E9|nr:hypothetical protein [Streptomyces sp. MBT33]MBK3641842.1 hypothetical protein [Streptomyces sp. MBT33]
MSIRSSSPDPHGTSIAAPHSDPVGALVHAAVADRPLEEVAHLITLLEQSPQYARATVDALRAVGTDRSVEDVTSLVALLTRPPRDPDSADEAIRAAAGGRPVDEVTRLMALLHRTPVEPHCGREAARVAATARPVEELVELIGRLSQERDAHAALPEVERQDEREAVAQDVPPDSDPEIPGPPQEGRAPRRFSRTPPRPASRHAWPAFVAATALLLCAMLWFPVHRDGVALRTYGMALGVSVLCAVLAALLILRPTFAALAVAVVVPAVLAAGRLYEGRFRSDQLSKALDLTLAPSWVAGLAAVCACLAALTALGVRLASQAPLLSTAVRPLEPARRRAE